MQRQLLWLWATPVQGVFRGQSWLDRRFVLLQMIPHLHETMELTVVFLIMRAQPIPSAAWHMHPWVRVQRVCLMACSSCACRQQKKVEISDRSMEQFCHVTFRLSSSPAATTWDPSIRQFVGLFRFFLRRDELWGPTSLLVGQLSVKKILCFLIPGSKHFSATTQKTFTRLLLMVTTPVFSLVMLLAFR